MDGLEMVYTRRSVRTYKRDQIPDDIIKKIVKAGKLAATARNLQPIEIVVIKNSEILRQLGQAADTGRFIADAPLCIGVFSQDTKYYLEDGSAATQNILLAARYFGIGSCWVAGDKKHYARKVTEICNVSPSKYKLISLIPLGYPASKGVFTEKTIFNNDYKEY
jgi:nitroreductase